VRGGHKSSLYTENIIFIKGGMTYAASYYKQNVPC